MAKARWNVAQRPEDTVARRPPPRWCSSASGKGGVGKSSVTVNLAAALAATGLTVGVLDADIWGFSVPRMLGVSRAPRRRGARRQEADGPARAEGRRRAAAHRLDGLPRRGRGAGADVARPDAQPRRQHFLQDVAWGDDLDYLLIDMPPGTGDVQMGVAKLLPRAEVHRRHHAGARRPEGGQPRRVDGPQELPAGRRRHREHERLHLRARRDLRPLRRGRRRGAGRRRRRAAARPDPARAGGVRRRRRPASRSCSARARPPRPSAPSPTASSPRPSRRPRWPAAAPACSKPPSPRSTR